MLRFACDFLILFIFYFKFKIKNLAQKKRFSIPFLILYITLKTILNTLLISFDNYVYIEILYFLSNLIYTPKTNLKSMTKLQIRKKR